MLRAAPCSNQIENHPNLQQPELLQFCRTHDIVVTSYAGLVPMTNEKVRDGQSGVSPLVASLAKKYGVTDSQVLQRWNLQGGKGVITTSTKPERIPLALGTKYNLT